MGTTSPRSARVRISEEELASGQMSPTTAQVAGALLREVGCVILPRPVVDDEDIRAARAAMVARLRFLWTQVDSRRPGADFLSDAIFSAELCSRTPGGRRYDVHLDHRTADTHVRRVLATMRAWSRQVVEAAGVLGDGLGGRVHSAGCVISLPGGEAQGFHTDGSDPGCINCFCPLVDVASCKGPTEVRLRSHLWPKWWAAKAGGCLGPDVEIVRAACFRGSLLLFDSRCLHRGSAHAALRALLPGDTRGPGRTRERLLGAARPMLYTVTVAPGSTPYDFFDHQSLLAH